MSETQRADLEARLAAHGYVFLEPFDLFSSVYVARALAPGRTTRLLRRVRARVRTAVGG